MAVSAAPSSHSLTREELRDRLKAGGAILVDVRARAAFEEGHLPGAVSLPVAEIAERARQVISDLSREVIVYCGSFT